MQKVTFEFGSLPIEHGVNTEITSFDDDGYIDGERLRVHDDKHLYFDEVDFTSAYLGDPFIPNFFSRGARLRQANYQQFLVKKKLSNHALASTDYTRLRATHTLREAVDVTLPKTAWLDSARGEFYQRVNDVYLYGVLAPVGYGFSMDVSKTFKSQLQTDIGYASIDKAYAAYSGSSFLLAVKLAWNSDSMMNGNHPFVRVNWKVAPGVALLGFYTHNVDSNIYSINGQTLEAGFNYNLADMLHKRHID